MKFRKVTAICLALATVPLVSAVTLDIKWLGGSGNWSTTGNWSTDSLPGGNNHVQIDPLNASNVTVNVDVAAATTDLTIGTNDTISVANTRSLSFDPQGATASIVLNAGSSLALNSAGNTTSLQFADGTTTASGSGTIDLSNKSNNQITGSGAATLINQTTIQGAGKLANNSLIINNQGTISALYATALVFDPSASADSTNIGALQALNGGLLQLVNGAINNTGGQILADNGGQVELSGITIKDGTLKTAGTGTITVTGTTVLSNGVTIDTGANVYLNNARNLQVADTLTIAGTLHLNSAGNSTNLILTSATTTFDGSGKVSLSNNTNNRIYGSPTTNTFVNKVTIEGAGQIGVNSATVNNQGTISALYSNALKLDPGAGGFTNTGTLNAATGGLLQLGDGTFTNTGGTISAASGSEIELLSGAKIIGGTLTSTGTGFFESRTSSTLDGVTLSSGSSFRIPNATNTTLLNSISNAGTLSLQSSGNSTDLIIDASGTTLSGGGVIELSNNTGNRIYGATAASLLTNTNNTIRGSGQIGVGQLAFTNQGTVEANLSGATLTIDPAASAFVNTGTYRAVNGGVLVLNTGSFNNNTGTIQTQTGSTVRLSGGTTVTQGILDVGPSAALQLAGGSFNNGSLTTAAGSTITTTAGSNTLGGTLNLVSGANLSLNNATNLSLLSSGTYTIDGTLTVDSSGNNTDLIISGGDVTLKGSGKVVLDNNSNNRVYGAASSNKLILDGLNLEGGGQLGVNLLGITSNAVISANAATTLTIDPSSTGFTNTGTLKADGGTLALTGGTYTNTGGFIESTAGSTVQFNASTFTGGTLKGTGTLTTVGANTFNGISLNSGSTLNIANATSGTFSGTLNNAGTLKINSAGNLTNVVAATSGLTLSGGGDVQLIGSNSRFYGTSGTTTLTNTNNTIRGYGQLGVNQLVFDNRSTVTADTNGQLLKIDTSGTLTNTGTFKAENGATLRIQSSTFDNQTGGSIHSDTSSNVQFSGLTLINGHLTGSGSFRNIASSTYSNLRLDAGTTLDIDNTTSAILSGTLNNAGQINLKSTGNLTDLIVNSAGLSIAGTGSIQLSGSGTSRIYGQTTAATITNGSGHTIAGFGRLGLNQLLLQNNGNIEADTGGTLIIDLTGTFTNHGNLKATGSGGISINDPLINQGDVKIASGSSLTIPSDSFTQSSGTTELTGGTLSATSLQVDGGDFDGQGTVSGATTFSGGFIAPNAGGLTFNSSLTLNSSATVQIELAGASAATGYGTLSANSLFIDGALQVRFGSGFENSILNSTVFTLLSATSTQSGTFNNATNGIRFNTSDGLGSFDVTYNALSVTLSNFQPVPEPATWSLFALGGCLIIWQSRRRRG